MSRTINQTFLKLLIIFLFLFSNVLFSKNQFNYYIFYDYNQCTGCYDDLLASYITQFKKLGMSGNFSIIINTKKKKELVLFAKKIDFNNIINDTLNQFSKIIENKKLPMLTVVNSEGIICYEHEDIKSYPVNLYSITKRFKTLDFDRFDSYKLNDSTFQLFRPSPPKVDKSMNNFITLDYFDNSIKEINIQTGKINRQIIPDLEYDKFFLKDTMNNYELLATFDKPLTKFYTPNYDNHNNILTYTGIVRGFKRDTVRVNNPIDSMQYHFSPINEGNTLSFTDNHKFDIVDLNDSIYIFGLEKTTGALIATIKYLYPISFDELKNGDFYLIAKYDSSNLALKNYYLKYKDVINYYNLKNYVGSSGLLAETNKKYVYLNPWNGIFCKFNESIEDSIHIMGYLEKVKLKDQPVYTFSSILEPSEITRYSINSLHSYKNKAIVYLQAIKGNRLTPFTVIQVYDIDKGLEKEIILNSTSNQYYFSYLLKIDEQNIYILNQNDSEDWTISKIPIKEIL